MAMLVTGHKREASLKAKREDEFCFSHVGLEVPAMVERSSSLPCKEENFQRIMNTVEGSCGKL